jgi:hypothetical protein
MASRPNISHEGDDSYGCFISRRCLSALTFLARLSKEKKRKGRSCDTITLNVGTHNDVVDGDWLKDGDGRSRKCLCYVLAVAKAKWKPRDEDVLGWMARAPHGYIKRIS